MGVRKNCRHKGCPHGDHRCSHPWWLDVMRHGVRYRMSVDEYAAPRGATVTVRTKKVATQWLARFTADIIEGHDPRQPPMRPSDPEVATVADCMVLYAASHVSQLKGRATATSQLKVLREHLGDLPLAALERPAPIEDFRRAFSDRKPATVNRYLARLRHLLGWAQEHGLVTRTPFSRYSLIISTKRETQRSRRVHPDEEQALVAACDQIDDARHWYAGRELKPRIEAALDLGLRRGEMLALRNRDVDWYKHRVVLRGETTKSAILRAIPFDPAGRVAAFLKTRRFLKADGYVFGAASGTHVDSFRTAWETLVLLAHGEAAARDKRRGRVNTDGLKTIDLHWHDLRHEAACRWREKGLDLREIQLLLGHSSLLVTERYLNISNDELADAMGKKLWGRR
jgi:integrase